MSQMWSHAATFAGCWVPVSCPRCSLSQQCLLRSGPREHVVCSCGPFVLSQLRQGPTLVYSSPQKQSNRSVPVQSPPGCPPELPPLRARDTCSEQSRAGRAEPPCPAFILDL